MTPRQAPRIAPPDIRAAQRDSRLMWSLAVRARKRKVAMPVFHRSFIIWCLLSLSAPHAQSPLPPGAWRIADAPAALKDPISRADLIVASLQDALLRELTHALEQGGPEFAIQSCHIDVVGAIRRVERRPGTAAGRTSDACAIQRMPPGRGQRPWFEGTPAGRRVRSTASRSILATL